MEENDEVTNADAGAEMLPVSSPFRYLAVSFTLKEQDWEQIKAGLQRLHDAYAALPGNYVLIHAFLPPGVVAAKGLSSEVSDTLHELFPNQLNFYDTRMMKPNRKAMARCVKDHNAIVYILGDELHGVQEEASFYRSFGAHIVNLLASGGEIVSGEEVSGEEVSGEEVSGEEDLSGDLGVTSGDLGVSGEEGVVQPADAANNGKYATGFFTNTGVQPADAAKANKRKGRGKEPEVNL